MSDLSIQKNITDPDLDESMYKDLDTLHIHLVKGRVEIVPDDNLRVLQERTRDTYILEFTGVRHINELINDLTFIRDKMLDTVPSKRKKNENKENE